MAPIIYARATIYARTMMKLTKSMVTLNQDIAGQEIGIPVYRINSKNAFAPVIYLQSAVHAAEMQGSAVIYQLLTMLKTMKLNANFIMVPNCNPFGRTQRAGEYLQGRFDATTGNNWNRFYYYKESIVDEFIKAEHANLPNLNQAELVSGFRAHLTESLAMLLNQEWGVTTAQFLNVKLQQYANEADVVLDLHCGPSSTRHIYSPDFLVDDSVLFNIENVISIPVEFAGALDEASFTPWQQLKQKLAALAITLDYQVDAFTIELGSQENISLQQAEIDAQGILNYLLAKGYVAHHDQTSSVKTTGLSVPITVTPLSHYKTLYSQYAGMVEYIKKAGDTVKKGETLARVLNSLEFDTEFAITDIVSPESGTVILHYPSAAVQVGTQLYKIAVDTESNHTNES